ncbi:MarR family transcriptional regulator [Paenibacillus cisolokensis]|uniref:MarR family winged helix-turn-helix transcriptional regulator n=1 Tax=Paenibacillus TaxID=44249 RepID=UPI0007222C40|nr:MarR family transcriptional regulator [Paenibacillus sp. 32O-W]ALS30155.1 MarR family transcriptional regulator [Paenibacillus sp. 32O-W]
MPDNAFIVELSNYFRTIVAHLTKEWNKRMVDNLNFTQTKMLSLLDANGPMKASRLAEELCMTSGALTGIADKLIASDHIVRERDENDRRVVYVRITEKGRRALKEVRVRQKETLSLVFQNLSPEDEAHLRRIFKKVMSALEQRQKE